MAQIIAGSLKPRNHGPKKRTGVRFSGGGGAVVYTRKGTESFFPDCAVGCSSNPSLWDTSRLSFALRIHDLLHPMATFSPRSADTILLEQTGLRFFCSSLEHLKNPFGKIGHEKNGGFRHSIGFRVNSRAKVVRGDGGLWGASRLAGVSPGGHISKFLWQLFCFAQ